ncbi:MAG: ABC transporter ATP-binding protein/permease [Clostridia bacterium]|nr:ABC transporter ATP-binding protein/permease [Clostridia bacterium]
MIKTLLKYFKPHRKLFILDMCCAMLASAVDLSFPLVSRYAMNELLPNNLYRFFFELMAIIAIFYVIRSVCYFIMTYWGHTFGIRVEADIRRDLFEQFQVLDFDFYDMNRTGNLMSRLTGDLFEITELSHHGPEDLVISSLTILGSLVFMFIMEWRLALVISILIPIFVIVVMKNRREMTRTSVNVKKKLAEINAEVESRLSGVRTSKAFANEDVDMERFDLTNENFKGAKKDYYKAMGTFMASQEFFMCIMPVVVIAFGGYLIMKGHMDYVDLITFMLFVSTFVTPIRKLGAFAEIFVSGTAGLRRFMDIMALEPSIKEKPDAKDLVVRDGGIRLDDVKFSYNEAKEVLHGIDLDVRPGEKVGIVGHSGGGKTTLCHLIPRFYDVTDGSISIDGQDIRDVTKHSLRKNIGIVQQDVFIFADTVLENIRYGKPDATYEEVVEAAKRAEIYDDIMDMPDGFDTYVGERGTKLSGGQKQRVSIARIFLKNPKILILDEATSALDTITEEYIQRSFDKLAEGRTTIIIAHRLTTVQDADRIVVVEGGLIKEQGTHEELLAMGGEYAKLYNA